MIFKISLSFVSLVGGLFLDFVIGDPYFRLHPVRLIGTLAERCERFFRPRYTPMVAGVSTWITVSAVVVITGSLVLRIAGLLGAFVGGFYGNSAGGEFAGSAIAGIVMVWASVACRDLARHAGRVHASLAQGDLAEARKKVAMIVGRDTANLDEEGIAKAATESVAESFVDGVAAPLFWAALLGPLGALAYRTLNTMDSLFGHKNERYLYFGRLAAKADDAATFLPARLASPFICLAALLTGGKPLRSWRMLLRDRLHHESPNSAHGEAAFAGALGVEMGGSVSYDGVVLEKPRIGSAPDSMPCTAATIQRAIGLMVVSTLLWAALMAGLASLCAW
jgi:adenosylcobinamide-phosphate synthase